MKPDPIELEELLSVSCGKVCASGDHYFYFGWDVFDSEFVFVARLS